MKRYERIIQEVAADVKDEMQFNIEFGYDSMQWEKYYGTAVVIVEVSERHTSFGWMTFTDVVVAHEDGHKSSPLLQEAIEKALPSWDKLKEEFNDLYN